MDELDFLNQILQANQQPQGMGPLKGPPNTLQLEMQKKVNQPVIIDPVIAQNISPPQAQFPTSLDEFKNYMKRQTDALSQQRQGVQGIESKIAQLSGPPQAETNLAPLLALSDFFGGTQLLQNYKTPQEKKKEKELQSLGYQMQLQKAKEGLTDKELDLYKAQYQDALGREKLASEEKLFKLKLGGDKGAVDKSILKTKESQKAQAQINLQNALNGYSDLVSKAGYQFSGEEADKMESAYADLKIKYKEAAALGALTGPDVKLLMEAIKPATGFTGGARELGSSLGISGGTEGALKGINQVKDLLSADFSTSLDALESAYGPSPVIKQYRQKFTSGKTQVAPGEVKEWQGKKYELKGDKWVEVK